MPCKKCNGKGYIETYQAGSASFTPSLQQCCDISAYSKEVQRRLSKSYKTEAPVLKVIPGVKAPAPVIPLRRVKKDET